MSSLDAQENFHRILISTTSRILGRYCGDGLIIAQAWSSSTDRERNEREKEGASSRSAYVIAFEAPIRARPGGLQLFTDYSAIGGRLCSYLSVLYGKRFDDHGVVEGDGMFYLPNLSQFRELCNSALPQNDHSARVDFDIPLNLVEFVRLDAVQIPEDAVRGKAIATFDAACKFYRLALQNVESDAEVAYLHLITVGEILSQFYGYKKKELLDARTLEILRLMEEELPDGKKAARFVAGRLQQVKKRFVQTVLRLVDKSFFNRTESVQEWGALKADRFEDTIAAAYDLRSHYVHSGVPFGGRVLPPTGRIRNELQVANRLIGKNRGGAKTLEEAPTYVGLERIMRYCILRFALENGLYRKPDEK